MATAIVKKKESASGLRSGKKGGTTKLTSPKPPAKSVKGKSKYVTGGKGPQVSPNVPMKVIATPKISLTKTTMMPSEDGPGTPRGMDAIDAGRPTERSKTVRKTLSATQAKNGSKAVTKTAPQGGADQQLMSPQTRSSASRKPTQVKMALPTDTTTTVMTPQNVPTGTQLPKGDVVSVKKQVTSRPTDKGTEVTTVTAIETEEIVKVPSSKKATTSGTETIGRSPAVIKKDERKVTTGSKPFAAKQAPPTEAKTSALEDDKKAKAKIAPIAPTREVKTPTPEPKTHSPTIRANGSPKNGLKKMDSKRLEEKKPTPRVTPAVPLKTTQIPSTVPTPIAPTPRATEREEPVAPAASEMQGTSKVPIKPPAVVETQRKAIEKEKEDIEKTRVQLEEDKKVVEKVMKASPKKEKKKKIKTEKPTKTRTRTGPPEFPGPSRPLTCLERLSCSCQLYPHNREKCPVCLLLTFDDCPLLP